MPRPDPQEIDRLIERILDAEPADWPPRPPVQSEASSPEYPCGCTSGSPGVVIA